MKCGPNAFAIALLLLGSASAWAQSGATGSTPATRHAYFGEMHLHTQMSFDAWTFGTRVTPDEAYKFASGRTILVQGKPATRAWPLDFMAVTDHSEFMGALTQLNDPHSDFSHSPLGMEILGNMRRAFFTLAAKLHTKPAPPELAAAAAASHAWDIEVRAANDNYQPGVFTTFVAYEWTSSGPGGTNLHRNVFFNADHAPQPFTSWDSTRPTDLWDFLDSVRARGIDAIAIPHNGNASNGQMYDWNDNDGNPITKAYAERRALNEPLTEIVQIKGQSDTVPALSPNDEFANFEIYDHLIARPGAKSNPHGSYIREAFGRGLVIESKVGANPYKFGLVGASDIHNGLSVSDENGFAGGAWGIDPKTMLPHGDPAKRILGVLPAPAFDADEEAGGKPAARANPMEGSSGGLTGVWAEENTRASIFAALKRKETFATSGTRIRVRMFGGWNFDANTPRDPAWVAKAYAAGVAMGSDLPAKPRSTSAPWLILEAQKDPDGANLDRIQIVKLWLDHGDYKEKIFDVALSDNRKPDTAGHVPPVGNTVDLKTGRYANTIGAAILTAAWRDPSFDPRTPAVYYARVLEIPTPRWSTLLAIANSIPVPAAVPATIQERAWTSPIWFKPS